MLYILQKGGITLAITKKRLEEIVNELRRKGEIVPATYDCIFKAIMRNCPKYRADTTSNLTDVSKGLILNTYKEMNTEYVIDNVLEKGKVSDVLFEVKGYVFNYEFNNRKWDGLIERNDAYLGKVKNDLIRRAKSYAGMPKVIQININNFYCFLSKENLLEFKSRDKYGIVESDKWGKIYVNLKLIREKYDRGLELTKLEKELVILTLTKVDEIDVLAEGDEELMEVANELKRLTNDAYTIGLYDEEEERRRVENSIKITARKQGVKQGIKQGAKQREKSIAKNLLKDGFPISKVCEYTGLSENQIARLV